MSVLTGGSLGCSERFPQHTGTYRLMRAEYYVASEGNWQMNNEFAGDRAMPSSITVTAYMTPGSGKLHHYMALEALPASPQEAAGSFTISLEALTRRADPGVGRADFDGLPIFTPKHGPDAGPYCRFQSHYRLYNDPGEMVGSSDVLRQVYYFNPELVSDGRGGSHELSVTPEEMAKATEIDDDAREAWLERVDTQGGMYLVLRISRHVDLETSGCDEDGIGGGDKSATLVATYKSVDHDESLSDDIRERKPPAVAQHNEEQRRVDLNSFFRQVITP